MRHPHFRSFWLELLAIVAALSAGGRPAAATVYSIVTTADDLTANANCTLREALQAARTNLAVDACPAGTAIDTIALGAGTYLLPLGVLDASSGEQIRIHGPNADPPTAVISGGGTHRIFDLFVAAGRLTLEDLELRDGNGLGGDDPLGGAVRAIAASLVARRVDFVANRARRGGAIAWVGTGPSRSLVVEGCRFHVNEALRPDPVDIAEGGALWLDPTDAASILVRDTDFVGNRASSALANDHVAGGAVLLVTEGAGAVVRFERLRFIDNVAEATGTAGTARAGAIDATFHTVNLVMSDLLLDGNDLGPTASPGEAAMALNFFGTASSTIDRLRIVGNGLAAGTAQASIWSNGPSSVVVLRDLLVAEGVDGLRLISSADAILAADHLTVTGNSGSGLILGVEAGSLTLGNSIVFDNGSDLEINEEPPTIRPETLVGVDPLFVDAAAGDYALAAGSPAEDAGDATWAFVGPYDLAHAARVAGAGTDLGAYERGALFSDGFEAGTTANWGW